VRAGSLRRPIDAEWAGRTGDRDIDCEEDRTLRAVLVGMLRELEPRGLADGKRERGSVVWCVLDALGRRTLLWPTPRFVEVEDSECGLQDHDATVLLGVMLTPMVGTR
jgi:hypothetical protein